MAQPESLERGALFDFAALDRDMRQEDTYARVGHTARTLVHEPDLRVVLVVMKAGSQIREHQAKDTVSIHVLSGRVRVGLPDRAADVAARPAARARARLAA